MEVSYDERTTLVLPDVDGQCVRVELGDYALCEGGDWSAAMGPTEFAETYLPFTPVAAE